MSRRGRKPAAGSPRAVARDVVAQLLDESSEGFKADLRVAKRTSLRAPRLMSVDEWADTYRVLPRGASAVPGKFRTSRVEVARGPMRAVTEPGVETVTVMSSTQLMKTTFIENVAGYYMHTDPSPLLVVQPREEDAEGFSKEKLTPMIRHSPALLELFGSEEEFSKQTPDNTMKWKRFPGGFLAITSAGSPANAARRPIRVTLLDEIDKYPAGDGDEGDRVKLFEERTSSFAMNSLHVRVCSPTSRGGRIFRSYHYESDRRRPFVECPDCGHSQVMRFSEQTVHWNKDVDTLTGRVTRHYPETARYICEGCGSLHDDAARVRMLKSIIWRQCRTFTCCGEEQRPEETRIWSADGRALCRHCGAHAVSNRHAGFWASKLYAPHISLSSIAEDFLEAAAASARGDHTLLEKFTNTSLAEPFEQPSAGRELDPDALEARAETFAAPPGRARLATAGIDTQGDRLEVEIVAWSDDDESWSVHFEKLYGDPNAPDVWIALDALLQRPIQTADGASIYVQAAAIDTGGHHMQRVLDFCGPRIRRRVWPIKGRSETSGERAPIWPSAPTTEPGRAPLYVIGTSAAKDRLAAMLRLEAPGPGYCHLPAGRDASWYEQLAGEKLVEIQRGGKRFTRWVPRYDGMRTEALDCRVYALAALYGLRRAGLVAPPTSQPAQTAAVKPGETSAPRSESKPHQSRKREAKRSSLW